MILTITSSPLLVYPDFELPFTLHIDASNKGLGAGLYQFHDNKMRILGFGSRALRKEEQGYHSSKLEFLSLKCAVCEQFRDYLLHVKEVHVYADNNPLLDVLSSAKLNATGQRWVNNLADFYLQIHYKPGRTNVDADTLSRFPEDINLYHNTLDKEKFQAITDGATTEQHKNEAWLCAMASSQILQEQENKVLQQSTQTLTTVNIK